MLLGEIVALLGSDLTLRSLRGSGDQWLDVFMVRAMAVSKTHVGGLANKIENMLYWRKTQYQGSRTTALTTHQVHLVCY